MALSSVISRLSAAKLSKVHELMASGIVDRGRIGIERSMLICDASGAALLVVPFRDAIALS